MKIMINLSKYLIRPFSKKAFSKICCRFEKKYFEDDIKDKSLKYHVKREKLGDVVFDKEAGLKKLMNIK